MDVSGEVLIAGEAEGPLLILSEPLSFWGGVDPASGEIIAARHPQCGAQIAGRLLVLPRPIGSSSSSSVLLELIAGGKAPAGLVLGQKDAILLLGSIVGRELGHRPVPALLLEESTLAMLPAEGSARIATDGRLYISAF
ncbi:aconitase X swivel domain-containing protein [Fodinicurvata halophila]|uniref:Aconitase X swivel domain-containing protein n=1 Tax=Fodinicurvata halophila TaxID=1419723 RepID=A0ABV8UNH6_9PROT